MLETKETIQFKNVDYNHNAIIKYLKTPGELHEYSDLIKVCPERNRIRSVRLQVYRREDTIWQNGNTDRVYVRYKTYDTNKQALTDYIDVPEGDIGTTQYVILDVEVPEETKYISFETCMTNPASSKEHEIKIEVISVKINNKHASLILAHNNLKQQYDYENMCWVHSFGPCTLTQGTAKSEFNPDYEFIHMTIDSADFVDYDYMTENYELELDGLPDRYIYIKNFKEEYTNTLVCIEEINIPVKINLDTTRTVLSQDYKWISSYVEGNYVINATGQLSNGMTIIPETVVKYNLNPNNYPFPVARVKLSTYCVVNNQIFYENYYNDKTGEHVYIKYSVDNGVTYNEVKTLPGSYLDIDIPEGIKTIYFKYSAKNTNRCDMYISADIKGMLVRYKKLHYYSDIFNSIESMYPPEDVIMGGKWYKKYTLLLQPLNRDYANLPEMGDVVIESDASDAQVKIGLYTNDGEVISDGKRAAWQDIAYYQVDVYIRNTFTTANPIKSIYLTDFEHRNIRLKTDTKRSKAVIQNLNSDSKRCIGVSANTLIKTQRHIIKSLISKIDTKRLLNKRDGGYLDTNRKQAIKNQFITDSIRSIGINKRITALTKRSIVKSFNILSDSSRLTTISKRLSLYDSKRTIAAADNSYTDSKRIISLKHSIKTDTTRTLLGQFFNNIQTKRLLIKNIASIANTIRKSSNNAYMEADTSRTLTKHKDALVNIDTFRRIAKSSSVNTDTRRSLVKSSRVYLDSKRRIAVIIRLYNDLTRKTIAINPDYYTKIDIKRIVIKNKEIAANTKRVVRLMGDGYVRTAIEVKRIVIKNDNIINDSKRFIGRFNKVLVDSSRRTLNRAINSFDITRRTGIREYGSVDSKRTIIQPYKALLDSNRKMAIRVDKALDICRKTIIGAREKLLIDVKRITRQVSNKRIDLYRKSVKIADVASDTYRNSITKEKNRAELIRKTIKEEIIWAEVTRDIYWHVDEVKYYDISRDIIVADSLATDLLRTKVIQDEINIDSKRDVYFEVEANKSFDIVREVAVKEEFKIDTDRLPFYFVNKKCEAKRVHIYHGGVFKVDTSRQKYLENMLRIGYDTLRAVKVIKPNTKVYEYNIKVCNTLVYDIQIPNVIEIEDGILIK